MHARLPHPAEADGHAQARKSPRHRLSSVDRAAPPPEGAGRMPGTGRMHRPGVSPIDVEQPRPIDAGLQRGRLKIRRHPTLARHCHILCGCYLPYRSERGRFSPPPLVSSAAQSNAEDERPPRLPHSQQAHGHGQARKAPRHSSMSPPSVERGCRLQAPGARPPREAMAHPGVSLDRDEQPIRRLAIPRPKTANLRRLST